MSPDDHARGGETTKTAGPPDARIPRRPGETGREPVERDDPDSDADGVEDGNGDGEENGRGDGDEPDEAVTFSTYTDEEYGYSLRYPADWIVEAGGSGRASFDARRGSAGATVDVDEEIGLTLAEYVAAFLDGLVADEHVHALECLDRRDVALDGGGAGRVVEYAYLSGARTGRWRLAYLFVREGTSGYTVGVDWNDADRLDEVAVRIVESFALAGS